MTEERGIAEVKIGTGLNEVFGLETTDTDWSVEVCRRWVIWLHILLDEVLESVECIENRSDVVEFCRFSDCVVENILISLGQFISMM